MVVCSQQSRGRFTSTAGKGIEGQGSCVRELGRYTCCSDSELPLESCREGGGRGTLHRLKLWLQIYWRLALPKFFGNKSRGTYGACCFGVLPGCSALRGIGCSIVPEPRASPPAGFLVAVSSAARLLALSSLNSVIAAPLLSQLM